MIKKIFVSVLIYVVLSLFMYLVCSFFEYNLNPKYWEKEVRLLICLIVCIPGTGLVAFYNVEKK